MTNVTARLAHGLASATTLACWLLGCEPTPNFPTPEQPVVGAILAEKRATSTGADQQVGLLYDQATDQHRLVISIPAGAYPRGTLLTFRLIADLGIMSRPGLVMNTLVGEIRGRFDALQVLPVSPRPALPLHVELIRQGSHAWACTLLHAHENDQDWSVVGTVNPGAATVAFDIDDPGLWTLVQAPLPPELSGRLQRTSLSCDDTPVANPPPALLEVSDTTYTWTHADERGCPLIQTGTVGQERYSDCFGAMVWLCFTFDTGNTGITLRWDSNGTLAGCPARTMASEHYVPAPADVTGLFPALPDGGCLIDAGEALHADGG